MNIQYNNKHINCTGALPTIAEFNLIKYKDEKGQEQRLHILTRGSHVWKDVAAQLFPNDPNLVKTLKQKHQGDPTSCLRELLQDFLTKGLPKAYTRDWKGVIELFKDAQDVQLAKDIKDAVMKKGK